MKLLIDKITELAKLSEGCEKQLIASLSVEKFQKDEFIIRSGYTVKKLYFIKEGLLRSFHYKEDREITNWFCSEIQFATSMYSFIAQKPSYENIQAIEHTTLISISYQNLQELYTSYPEFDKIGRLLTEQYYLSLEDRIMSLQFRSAKERYEHLLNNEKHLLQRVSLGILASYLGITQETLSRIRKNNY